MGGSIQTVQGHAHILRDKVDGMTKFRWSCSCLKNGTYPPQTRRGEWHRMLSTVLESFRQHWNDVHKAQEPPDWDMMFNRVAMWAIQPPRDDEGRWVAPSGKRPAVAADYRTTNYFVQADKAAAMMNDYFITPTFEEERKGMSRLSDIEARLRELEKEAAKYARFPKTDEWAVGTVITYDWTAPKSDAGVFTYAVIKATAVDWYWTGAWRVSGKHGDYDFLVEHLADTGVSNIRVATPEDFDPLFPELADLVSTEALPEAEKAVKEGMMLPRLTTPESKA